MKKTKLLMLSTIATLASITPVITITSCKNDNNDKSKFVCVESKQETEIGKSACWYTFNLTGKKQIPSDLEIAFDGSIPEKLVTQPLWHTVEGSEGKQLIVGIDGKSKLLTENEEIGFKLSFKSLSLKIDQTFDCTYKFHAAKVIAEGERVVDKDPSQLIENTYHFLLDKSVQPADLELSIINVKKSSQNIPDFTNLEFGTTGNRFYVKTKLVGAEGVVIGKAGDYVIFDLEFHDKENTWSQTITNFGFEFRVVDYDDCETDTETEVVIDYKGNKQKALKAMNGKHGVLTTDTPVGTPFSVTFDLAEWKDEWGKATQWKFGSYVHPTQSHVQYYHYSNISIYAEINGKENPIEQTEPGDYEGERGLWWVSEGGPITILYNKFDIAPTKFIFRLRTAEKITNESSFYITYA